MRELRPNLRSAPDRRSAPASLEAIYDADIRLFEQGVRLFREAMRMAPISEHGPSEEMAEHSEELGEPLPL